MLEREWVSVRNPDDPHDRYVFDVSFLLSGYECIYGRGCPGITGEPNEVLGCCVFGAHYVDDADRERTEAMVDELGPSFLQHYGEAAREGVSVRVPGEGQLRTPLVDGACIFLNRGDFGTGPGCALHTYAVSRGEHHMTYKPEVCWMVPLRREVAESVDDDGETLWTTTISSFDRGAWGSGGADFRWWCTDTPSVYQAQRPVYESMEAELRTMTTDAVYEELWRYLDRRRTALPKPLPVFALGPG